MSDATPPSPVREPRPKRHKIDVACDMCRARKVKCDGIRPACGNCLKRLDIRDKCTYSANTFVKTSVPGFLATPVPPERDRLGTNDGLRPPSFGMTGEALRNPIPQRPTPQSTSAHSPSVATVSSTGNAPTDHSPSLIDSMTTVIEEGASTQQYFGSSSAGSFTRQIKAAIDARLGKLSTKAPDNAPTSRIFPSAPSRDVGLEGSPAYVLPPRRQADHYMGVYWLYVDPLYPFLDRNRWNKSYDGLFSGTAIEADERIFLTTLNVVFALSIQLMEDLHPEQREESSNVYFQRAQSLLPLNLWEPGSIELVQCLLLMSQYLQSTNNPHHTWMVVGSAIRTAQSLGLHLPETSADLTSPSERELLRRIWHGCVLMDRMVSVTHGRPTMISSHFASAVPLPLSTNDAGEHTNKDILNDLIRVSFFVKSVELYEIVNLIIRAFYSTPTPATNTGGSSGNAPSEPANEDLGTLMKLDESLSAWERKLPRHLNYDHLAETENETCQRQAVILHIRLLQARILLLRPAMSRFCLGQPSSDTARSSDNLTSRVMQQCASFCAATSQKVITILAQFDRHDGTVGLLPSWWYRLYYVYSAATILIVAKLRPDTFPSADINRSWAEAMSVLQAHEKFGQSARRCVAALNILSTRILQGAQGTRPSSALEATSREGSPNPVDYLQGFTNHFDEMAHFPDLDLTSLSFDANDLSTLNLHAWELLNQS